MRLLPLPLPLAVFLLVLAALPEPAQGAPAKIKKVLIQFLDQDGRHTTAPSLYERDAYQAYLRAHPEKRSGLRAAIHWRGPTRPLRLRFQLRGTRADKETIADLLQPVTPSSGWARWDMIALRGEEYARFGELIAWRVSLWDGETLLAEQASFLW